MKKSITVDGSRVTLNIWDTAGQERYHALGPIYYRDSNGALLVYDVADPDSLSKVKTWVKELRKMLGSSVCLAIVGNKIDLLPVNERSNPQSCPLIQEAIQYSESISQSMNVKHYLSSAKSNFGIDETFLDLSRRMMKFTAEKSGLQATTSSMNVTSSNNNRSLRIASDQEEELDMSRSSVTRNKCSC